MAANEFSLFDGACWYGVFLFSTTLHEASHAFAAFKMGDDTAYRAGQVSLDPTPHIRREPFGMVVVPLLSYFLMGGYMIGWASAPYDPAWEQRYPRRAGIMAMAGPLANLILMLLAVLFIRLGMAMNFFHISSIPHGSEVAIAMRDGIPHLCAVLLSITFSLNLVLFVFNLLPLPPLDGSNIPLLFLSHEGAARYSSYLRHPTFALIGVIVGYRLFPYIFRPVQEFVTNLFF